MATTLDNIVQRPYMLNDLAAYTQRVSALLPPDGWEAEDSVSDLVSNGAWDDDVALITHTQSRSPTARRTWAG
jgi:hypothetical protein